MGKQKHKLKKLQKRDILDNETLQYYQRISHELKQDFDDDESKGKEIGKSTFVPCTGSFRT